MLTIPDPRLSTSDKTWYRLRWWCRYDPSELGIALTHVFRGLGGKSNYLHHIPYLHTELLPM